jgi:predicted nucleic acid-binding protein
VATQLYLVDTSVWIFALRRNPPEAIRRRLGDLLEIDAVATCGLVELELLGGTRDEAEFDRLRMRLGGLRRLPIDPGD